MNCSQTECVECWLAKISVSIIFHLFISIESNTRSCLHVNPQYFCHLHVYAWTKQKHEHYVFTSTREKALLPLHLGHISSHSLPVTKMRNSVYLMRSVQSWKFFLTVIRCPISYGLISFEKNWGNIGTGYTIIIVVKEWKM